MKVKTESIAWHGKEAVFSVDVQPKIAGQPQRIATAGLDCNVRLWKRDSNNCIKFLSNLSRHEKAVNIVRFSTSGEFLASAGDDAIVVISKLSEVEESFFLDEEKENIETWAAVKYLRGHLEDVNDLQWSADDSLIITGAVDRTAILWDVEKGQSLKIFNEAKHFVNGVTIDPLSHYAITMSSDRAMRVYNIRKKKIFQTVTKMKAILTNGSYKDDCNSCPKDTAESEQPKDGKSEEKLVRMFHDETVVRRRLSFTGDGKVLVVPAGCIHYIEDDNKRTKSVNAVLLFSRHNMCKPFAFLPGLKDPPSLVAMCPVVFQNRKEKADNNLNLGYRYVFAVASTEDIILYDTESVKPFGLICNIHYSSITDMSWSHDASFLMVSSRDGFCSMIEFEENEIGIPFSADDVSAASHADSTADNLPHKPATTDGKESEPQVITQISSVACTSAAVSSDSEDDEPMDTTEPPATTLHQDQERNVEEPVKEKRADVHKIKLDSLAPDKRNNTFQNGSPIPAKTPRRIVPLPVKVAKTPTKSPRRVNLVTISRSLNEND